MNKSATQKNANCNVSSNKKEKTKYFNLNVISFQLDNKATGVIKAVNKT